LKLKILTQEDKGKKKVKKVKKKAQEKRD